MPQFVSLGSFKSGRSSFLGGFVPPPPALGSFNLDFSNDFDI